MFVCDSQNRSTWQLEIDGISCDNAVTTATILPKGGPPCSLWAGYSDFHQLSRQSLSYTSIPLVPKLPKPSDKERDTEKNNTEKVPITPPVIVLSLAAITFLIAFSDKCDWQPYCIHHKLQLRSPRILCSLLVAFSLNSTYLLNEYDSVVSSNKK